MEKHVSNHRQYVEDLSDCADRITKTVHGEEPRVENLIDSIDCAENTVQATIGLIRSNVGGMRSNFEKFSSAFIEVDPYMKSMKRINKQRTAQISALDYKPDQGITGVDLRWHTQSEYSQDQKDELRAWLQTPAGKDVLSK